MTQDSVAAVDGYLKARVPAILHEQIPKHVKSYLDSELAKQVGEQMKVELPVLVPAPLDHHITAVIQQKLQVLAQHNFEATKLAYSEKGSEIRHYSTTRSALTTFLLTVSIAAITGYYNYSRHEPFLAEIAVILLISSALTCFCFSYRTEKSVLQYSRLWNSMNGIIPSDSGEITLRKILKRMALDGMNWLLLFVLGFAAISLWSPEYVKHFFDNNLGIEFLPPEQVK